MFGVLWKYMRFLLTSFVFLRGLQQPRRSNSRIATVTLRAPDPDGRTFVHRGGVSLGVAIFASYTGSLHALSGDARTNDI